MTCFWVWSITQRGGRRKADKIEFWDNTWEDERSKSVLNITQTLCLWEHRGRAASLKLYAYPLFYRVGHSFKTILRHVRPQLTSFFVGFIRWTRQHVFIRRVQVYTGSLPLSVNVCFGKTCTQVHEIRNSTCTHRRWFQVRREPDVCVVRPSHGLHAWAGTGPSPSSRSPGDCPCWQAVGRRLDPAYLCESACHWWHGLFTELRRWGNLCSPIDLLKKVSSSKLIEYNWNVLSLN